MSGLVDAAISLAKSFFKTTQVVTTVDGVTVTAGSLETAAGTLSAFLAQWQAAIKARNYAVTAELTIDEGLLIAKDIGVGGIPVAVAAALLPFIFQNINNGNLTAGSLSDNAGEQQNAIIADRFPGH